MCFLRFWEGGDSGVGDGDDDATAVVSGSSGLGSAAGAGGGGGGDSAALFMEKLSSGEAALGESSSLEGERDHGKTGVYAQY